MMCSGLHLEDYQNGQRILIDKPLDWTSFQVVNKVRWLLRKRFHLKKIKVGHAGTLDPLATGLLILCTGKLTKQIESIQGQTKEYTGIITLGATTPSYDLETEIDKHFAYDHLLENQLLEATASFEGSIQQVPPLYSALKKDGKRLYHYAREGQHIDLPPREVHVHEFTLSDIALPQLSFRVRCSKGTYIRSLVHDFGLALGSGAHLSALRRTKIGDFDVINAQTPSEFEAALHKV